MVHSDSREPEISVLETEGNYGKFVVEPLEPGYGPTLGNSLRRVLLSSVEGAAVTSVKIEGVQHEFQSIAGLKEDATELFLNLKELCVKVHDDAIERGEDVWTLRIDAKGAGVITGADVNCPTDVEIANPDVYLARISDEAASLYVELTVRTGRGYVMPDTSRRSDIIGEIPVPSAFGPVRKVNYTVDPTRVGNRNDYERLTLEVTTNGTIEPAVAVSQAAELLTEHFERFMTLTGRPLRTAPALAASAQAAIPAGHQQRIEELDFSVRTYNCLKKAQLLTLHDLTQISEVDLLNIRNFGRKSLTEVKEKLQELGLALKDSGLGEYPDFDEE